MLCGYGYRPSWAVVLLERKLFYADIDLMYISTARFTIVTAHLPEDLPG